MSSSSVLILGCLNSIQLWIKSFVILGPSHRRRCRCPFNVSMLRCCSSSTQEYSLRVLSYKCMHGREASVTKREEQQIVRKSKDQKSQLNRIGRVVQSEVARDSESVHTMHSPLHRGICFAFVNPEILKSCQISHFTHIYQSNESLQLLKYTNWLRDRHEAPVYGTVWAADPVHDDQAPMVSQEKSTRCLQSKIYMASDKSIIRRPPLN